MGLEGSLGSGLIEGGMLEGEKGMRGEDVEG